MRYYNFKYKTSSEQIEKTSTIKLKDYDYESPIAAINNYFHQKKDNDISFFMYREEDDMTYACFGYDEEKWSFTSAYDYIFNFLNNVIGDFINEPSMITIPCEITLIEYADYFFEGRRRCYVRTYRRGDAMPEWFHDYFAYNRDFHDKRLYTYDEFIVTDEVNNILNIYDESLVDELKNIEIHKAGDDGLTSIVHYFVASKSTEASKDIVNSLTYSLYKANRIDSKRICVINNLDPEIYKKTNYLEEIIENNSGGTIVIDLSERLENKPEEYLMTSKYIEKLFKKYRNKCLFIFTYNMDNPGFSFYLLPELKKYAIPVALKEGASNKETATKYLESLILKSEYAEYSHQAEEFMSMFKAETYSQSDVLAAFDKFEPWCINKNIMKAYDFNLEEGFMLDRDDNDSTYDTLQGLIGLDIVKKRIDDILATNAIEKERRKLTGDLSDTPTMHMVFAGSPGTAKTTVAKLFAKVAKERGLISSGVFVERSGVEMNSSDLITSSFVAAKGGVLFIDEAYALNWPSAITKLVQEIENNREDVIVIFAGYNGAMEMFLRQNDGLKSRVPYWVDFPDYSLEELTEIFKYMLKNRRFKVTDEALKEVIYILEKAKYEADFGNGRYVRNLIERIIQNQSVRIYGSENKDLFLIEKEDVTSVNEGQQKEREKGSAQKELDEMIGLSSVKDVISKALANYKFAKRCLDNGINREKPSLHMVFTGNPGTAKTTVARLLAEILKDEKVLPTNKFSELGKADVVSPIVGATAHIVKSKFREAQGGVLFIDEAYSLCDGISKGPGEEAINTIVQEMENHRNDVIVIFAGYPKQMQEFLEKNPGMKSRIAFQVDFEDYTVDELCDITKVMAKKKGIKVTKAAMKKLRSIYESVYEEEDYGNGRFVRKMLEEAEMNLARRLMNEEESKLTKEFITTIDACDIPEGKSKKIINNQIGFTSRATA